MSKTLLKFRKLLSLDNSVSQTLNFKKIIIIVFATLVYFPVIPKPLSAPSQAPALIDYKLYVNANPINNNRNASCMQDDGDRMLLLQKCIDLAELQQYYPKDLSGTFRPLNLVQYSVSFDPSINVLHSGNHLIFKNKSDIKDQNIDAYFLFLEFQVGENSSRIDFVFYYDQTTAKPKMQVVSLSAEKTASGWTVTRAKIEGRES